MTEAKPRIVFPPRRTASPEADSSSRIEGFISSLADHLRHQINRSYENRGHKNSSTELGVQLHRSKPGVLSIKVREESSLVVGTDRSYDLISSIDLAPMEQDELSLSYNRCVSDLRHTILPLALSVYDSQAAFSSLDITLRFRSGRFANYTFRLDALC